MRRLLPYLAVLVVFILPACGLPADDGPRAIAPERLPPGLVEPLNATTSTDVPAAAETPVSVWMVREDGLISVRRLVPEPLEREAVVAALLAGTTADDPPGVRSAWTHPDQVGEVTVTAGTASVELTDRFADVPASDQLFAVAQMVFTLTGLPGIGQVQFVRDGEPVSLPAADGSTSLGPVSRDDYRALVEP
ncbi:MAG: GerMN domain-containing protein [Ilumatobacteraceae bacterium]|jgi:sporulation and spore germination protein